MILFSMHWLAETTFHSLTKKLGTLEADMKLSHFGMDVANFFGPGELRVRWTCHSN